MAVPYTTRAKTKRVEVLLAPVDYERLKEESKIKDIPMTDILKKAIGYYLDKEKKG